MWLDLSSIEYKSCVELKKCIVFLIISLNWLRFSVNSGIECKNTVKTDFDVYKSCKKIIICCHHLAVLFFPCSFTLYS